MINKEKVPDTCPMCPAVLGLGIEIGKRKTSVPLESKVISVLLRLQLSLSVCARFYGR